jgi:hypothetical protein
VLRPCIGFSVGCAIVESILKSILNPVLAESPGSKEYFDSKKEERCRGGYARQAEAEFSAVAAHA